MSGLTFSTRWIASLRNTKQLGYSAAFTHYKIISNTVIKIGQNQPDNLVCDFKKSSKINQKLKITV